MQLKDQLDRTLFLNKIPNRIVCLVPSLSELLVDLGLQENLMGITKFCVHPKDLLKEKVIVGGTKQVHYDRIEALRPDIILCNKEENTPEIVDSCSHIAPTHVSDIKNLDDLCELIIQYGQLFSVGAKAAKLIDAIQLKSKAFRRKIKEQPIKRVAYLIWRKPYMAAGSDTFIDYMLELNGFENIFFEKEGRYPKIKQEELKGADLVLLSSEPYPFKEKHVQEIAQHTEAQVLLVDGEYFSWYGSRLLGAFEYFEGLQLLLKKR